MLELGLGLSNPSNSDFSALESLFFTSLSTIFTSPPVYSFCPGSKNLVVLHALKKRAKKINRYLYLGIFSPWVVYFAEVPLQVAPVTLTPHRVSFPLPSFLFSLLSAFCYTLSAFPFVPWIS